MHSEKQTVQSKYCFVCLQKAKESRFNKMIILEAICNFIIMATLHSFAFVFICWFGKDTIKAGHKTFFSKDREEDPFVE